MHADPHLTAPSPAWLNYLAAVARFPLRDARPLALRLHIPSFAGDADPDGALDTYLGYLKREAAMHAVLLAGVSTIRQLSFEGAGASQLPECRLDPLLAHLLPRRRHGRTRGHHRPGRRHARAPGAPARAGVQPHPLRARCRRHPCRPAGSAGRGRARRRAGHALHRLSLRRAGPGVRAAAPDAGSGPGRRAGARAALPPSRRRARRGHHHRRQRRSAHAAAVQRPPRHRVLCAKRRRRLRAAAGWARAPASARRPAATWAPCMTITRCWTATNCRWGSCFYGSRPSLMPFSQAPSGYRRGCEKTAMAWRAVEDSTLVRRDEATQPWTNFSHTRRVGGGPVWHRDIGDSCTGT